MSTFDTAMASAETAILDTFGDPAIINGVSVERVVFDESWRPGGSPAGAVMPAGEPVLEMDRQTWEGTQAARGSVVQVQVHGQGEPVWETFRVLSAEPDGSWVLVHLSRAAS